MSSTLVEKYSLLLSKERELREKSEKAAQLAAKRNFGIRHHRSATYSGSSKGKGNKKELTKTVSLADNQLSRTWNGEDIRSFHGFKKIKSIDSETDSTDGFPQRTVTKARSTNNLILLQRLQEAEARKLSRQESLKSLDEDCRKAQWILYRMKATSMPSLADSNTFKDSLREKLNDSFHSIYQDEI